MGWKGLLDSEMTKVVDNLREHPDKTPSPFRDDMMEMFNHIWEDTIQNDDGELAFKQNIATIVLMAVKIIESALSKWIL